MKMFLQLRFNNQDAFANKKKLIKSMEILEKSPKKPKKSFRKKKEKTHKKDGLRRTNLVEKTKEGDILEKEDSIAEEKGVIFI